MAISATDETKISTASKSARLRDIFWVFVRIGLLSFGGPAGQIALMHRILVDEKEWLDEQSFLNALNFCMLLPGPEAMQLATFAGWRLRRFRWFNRRRPVRIARRRGDADFINRLCGLFWSVNVIWNFFGG